jgi:Ser/Thr protein kinase RdoA (MazF antagonist)
LDVANAVWEFCSDDESHALDSTAAQAFLQAYAAAGGPVTDQEFDLLLPFIRCRRLIEILTALHGVATGDTWDESPDYLVHNLIALEKLQTVRL